MPSDVSVVFDPQYTHPFLLLEQFFSASTAAACLETTTTIDAPVLLLAADICRDDMQLQVHHEHYTECAASNTSTLLKLVRNFLQASLLQAELMQAAYSTVTVHGVVVCKLLGPLPSG